MSGGVECQFSSSSSAFFFIVLFIIVFISLLNLFLKKWEGCLGRGRGGEGVNANT